MLIKETIITEIDRNGKTVRRTRETRVYDRSTDYGYDYGTRYSGFGEPYIGSARDIRDAYEDYRRCREW